MNIVGLAYEVQKNRELRWLFAISRPYLGWMVAGVSLATAVILANVALLAGIWLVLSQPWL
ncbi:hypothetical protein P4S72_18225 [Vibrio sp. PP-XX7]